MPDDLFGDPLPRGARHSKPRRTLETDIRTVPCRIRDVARFVL